MPITKQTEKTKRREQKEEKKSKPKDYIYYDQLGSTDMRQN
jgi:hypothetical protein